MGAKTRLVRGQKFIMLEVNVDHMMNGTLKYL